MSQTTPVVCVFFQANFALFTAYVQSRAEIVKIVDGSPCTVEAENSNVKLAVPENVKGTITGQTHNDASQFEDIIPVEECLVSPICQFVIQPEYGTKIPEEVRYKIHIPHIIRGLDLQQIKKHIRIKHGDIHNGDLQTHRNDDIFYELDKEFITVTMPHFSTYIVIVEGIKCCSSRATALLFGSLDHPPGADPLASLRVYFTNYTTGIKDYDEVRELYNIRRVTNKIL